MRYLFKDWEKIFSKIKISRRIFFFLDYDGTLTSIVSRPEAATISPAVRRVIEKLKSHPRFKVAIISGRSLKDIKKMVGVKGIIYAANHGLEIQYGDKRLEKPAAFSSRPLLQRIRLLLEVALKDIKGTIVEDKGSTLSVHFRMAKSKDRGKIKNTFNKILRPYIDSESLKVTSGKMVLEVRPVVEWDKGQAVLKILGKKTGTLPIYLGDDITDEDAFRAIKGKGISVFVGRPKKGVCADYFLRDPRETAMFIEKCSRLNPKNNG